MARDNNLDGLRPAAGAQDEERSFDEALNKLPPEAPPQAARQVKKTEKAARMIDERYGVRELAPALKSGGEPPHSKTWPHAPTHRLTETGVYMITSGTYRKQHFFQDGPRLRMLHDALLSIAGKHGWRLEAWAVFPNHYHFIGHAPEEAATLTGFLRELHSRTAVALNRHDATPGRKVWQNYWETRLTHEKSYLARLHYVHQNPVKHAVATVANQYPCCSAAWFERTATAAQVKTIYSFKTDQLHVDDDF